MTKPVSRRTDLPRGDEDLEKAGSISAAWATRARCSTSKPRPRIGRRLSELREELEEAKELGNVERAEQAEAGDRRADAGSSRAPSDSVDVIAGRRQLRNEPARASPRRSRRCWKESRRAMPRWEISSRDASRPAPSAPTSLTLISRSRGNSLTDAVRPSSLTVQPSQVAIPLQRVPIVRRPRRRCWRFLRSRSRNEPPLWGGNPNVARFARSSIVR